MEVLMTASLKMTKKKEKEFLFMLMGMFMKEILKMVKKKAKEF